MLTLISVIIYCSKKENNIHSRLIISSNQSTISSLTINNTTKLTAELNITLSVSNPNHYLRPGTRQGVLQGPGTRHS